MDLTAWALYLTLAAVIIAGVHVNYRYREPGGRGRALLATLRGLAAAVLVLLLFDVRVPGGDAPPGAVLALLDGSLSMAMPDSAGATPWAAAAEAAAQLGADRVVTFGEGVGQELDPGDEPPGALRSRLAPALGAAIETGARRVVVLTDGALEDPVETHRVLGSGSAVEIRRVGGTPAFNAGLMEVRVPAWARAGEEIMLAATVAVVGSRGPDSVAVAVRRDGRELVRRRVRTPPAGRVATVELPVTPTAGEEPVRFDVVVMPGGSMPDDDRRSAYVEVADEPSGVAVVSLRPGQEPRFLVPALERALALPVRSWLRVGEDRWILTGAGTAPGPASAPVEAVADAQIVVLHGYGPDAPAWASRAAAATRPLLVFPGQGAGDGAQGLPFAPGREEEAEWYAASEIPPSPVAARLAGGGPEGLPPLMALRRPAPAPSFWAPLAARAGRRGPARPVVVAGRADGRRMAVALGRGYWRWAFAGTEGRAFYDRFWSAVVGWLAEADLAATEIRPVDRVVTRGAPVRWRVGAGWESARVRLVRMEEAGGDRAASDSAVDTTVADRRLPVDDGIVALPGVGPGHYRYTVTAGTAAEGRVTVSRYTPELTRPRTLADTSAAGSAAGSVAVSGQPLRATPWPYLVVVLLLTAEWGLRRRWGLR